MSARQVIRVERDASYGQYRLRDGNGTLVMDGVLPLSRSSQSAAEREAEFVEAVRRSPPAELTTTEEDRS
jgi:hypothetical protein